MDPEERIKLVVSATPEQKAAVDRILSGLDEKEGHSFRTFTLVGASRESGISRTTLHRAIVDGRLKRVEIREGSFRIPESELRRFVGAK